MSTPSNSSYNAHNRTTLSTRISAYNQNAFTARSLPRFSTTTFSSETVFRRISAFLIQLPKLTASLQLPYHYVIFYNFFYIRNFYRRFSYRGYITYLFYLCIILFLFPSFFFFHRCSNMLHTSCTVQPEYFTLTLHYVIVLYISPLLTTVLYITGFNITIL